MWDPVDIKDVTVLCQYLVFFRCVTPVSDYLCLNTHTHTEREQPCDLLISKYLSRPESFSIYTSDKAL